MIIVLCVFVLAVVYIICRSPLAQFVGFLRAYTDSDRSAESIKEYRGATCFINHEYKNFKKGSDFGESVELYRLTDYGEVTDFYHRDYTEYNRRYLGECPNTFILDIQATNENYTLCKTTLLENMCYQSDFGAFQIYEENSSNNEYGMTYIMIGFDDANKIIRYIYVVSNGNGFSLPGAHLLARYTSSELWAVKTD